MFGEGNHSQSYSLKAWAFSLVLLPCILSSLPAAAHGSGCNPEDLKAAANAQSVRASELPTTSAHTQSHRGVVAIVDAYSSGRYLAAEFRKNGFDVVHVQSEKVPLAVLVRSMIPNDFSDHYIYEGNEATLPETLLRRGVRSVIVGAETGVLVGDLLATAMNNIDSSVLSNGFDYARRDKFLMGKAMRRAGLDAITETLASDSQEAIEWIRKHNLFSTGSKQVVIKPRMSAGTQGFRLCKSEADVVAAFNELIRSKDLFEREITELLVQERLVGKEIVVNTTSLEGDHKITDIWTYLKRLTPNNKHWIYDSDELLPSYGHIQDMAVDYAKKALDALGVKTGNGHIELMHVPGRGIVLIEANIRMMGQSQPVLARMAIGSSQIDKTVLAFSDPKKFHELPERYEWNKHAAVVTLANLAMPAKLNPQAEQILKSIPGVVKVSLEDPNKIIPLTTNMLDAAGYVWILHEDEKVVRSAVKKIRDLESSGALLDISVLDRLKLHLTTIRQIAARLRR